MSDWIEWKGGECPVAGDSRPEVKFRDGNINLAKLVAYEWRWDHWGQAKDIIAYRVVDKGGSAGNGGEEPTTTLSQESPARERCLTDSSPTPRTDAAAFPFTFKSGERHIGLPVVSAVNYGHLADFARTLERENAKLLEQLARMRISTVQQELEMEGLRRQLAEQTRLRQMADHERDEMLEKLIAAESALAAARRDARERCATLVPQLSKLGYTPQAIEGHIRALSDEERK